MDTQALGCFSTDGVGFLMNQLKKWSMVSGWNVTVVMPQQSPV